MIELSKYQMNQESYEIKDESQLKMMNVTNVRQIVVNMDSE